MGQSEVGRDNIKRDDPSSTSQGGNQREQQHPQANTQPEDGDVAEHGVTPVKAMPASVAIVIKCLEVLAAITGLAAGILWGTSHHLFFSVSIFITVTALVSALCLFWAQKWREGPRYRTPLIAFTFLVALALTSVVCWKTYEMLASNAAAAKKPDSSPAPPPSPFIIRERTSVLLPGFPQPLLYVYSSSDFVVGEPTEKFIAPVGLAINLEVINGKNAPAKIQSYVADLEMGDGSWERVFSLPTQAPHRLYFDVGFDFKKCVELDFTPHLFDVVAGERTLLPGESLNGWVFFEWSREVREKRGFRRVRIRVENLQNESAEAVFDFSGNPAQETGRDGRGVSLLNAGAFRAKYSGKPPEYLSRLPIRPFRSE